MYRIWIDRGDQTSRNRIAVEKDGERLPSAFQVEILGPSRVVFDLDCKVWPQGWVETESEVIYKEESK